MEPIHVWSLIAEFGWVIAIAFVGLAAVGVSTYFKLQEFREMERIERLP